MTRKAQRIVRMIYAGYSDNQGRTPEMVSSIAMQGLEEVYPVTEGGST